MWKNYPPICPFVIIDTDEEIPGVPYYEEGGYHRMYTTTMLGENDLLANMRVIDHQDTVNKVDDAPDITTSIRIRVRGILPGGLIKSPTRLKQ